MTPPRIELRYAPTTKRLIGLFFDVYHELGHGFLDSVYEEAFAVALEESGLKFERQKPLTVWFGDDSSEPSEPMRSSKTRSWWNSRRPAHSGRPMKPNFSTISRQRISRLD